LTSAIQEIIAELARNPAEGRPQDTPEIGWPGRLVRTTDMILRRCLGVREFCADSHCIIRIAHKRARADLSLRDGTRIARGDLVGELHFWNEQLPRIPPGGPGFGWALAMQRQFVHSLRRLAAHAALDDEFGEITAFRGDIMFAGALSRGAKLEEVGKRYGFEIIEPERSPATALHELFGGLFIACLIRTFNPAGLRKSAWRRRRYEVWISKKTLIERYGMGSRAQQGRAVNANQGQRG